MPASTRRTRVSNASTGSRFSRTGTVALLGAFALTAPMTAYAATGDEPAGTVTSSIRQESAPTSAGAAEPTAPNPYLALLPDPSKADYAAWDRRLAQKAEARKNRLAARPRPGADSIRVEEDESGHEVANDVLATAQVINGFGTGRKESNVAEIHGALSPQEMTITRVAPSIEDDGAIPLARHAGRLPAPEAITTSGTVGDGPYGSTGSGTGDFDFYALEGQAGNEVVFEVHGVDGFSPTLRLFRADGTMIGSSPWLINYLLHEDGTYYAMVSGAYTTLNDPFDPASGTGATSEGGYTITVGQRARDIDVYAVNLSPGDVVSASVDADYGIITTLFAPDGTEVQGSQWDRSAHYPPTSPLPGGVAVTEHVASTEGLHYLQLRNSAGDYDIDLEVYRSTAEQDPKGQTLFLDFDGERVNTALFAGPGVRDLSPFRAWIGRWGLAADQEEAVARQVIETVTENLKDDLEEQGLAGRIRLNIKNSYDHKDPFGDPNVSRVVIGGSINESGIATIGIAQYIDPGNFGHEDSALVLLDVLSGAASDSASLNHYITEESDLVAFVGQALGNVVAHEAGHFLGSWHTDPYNEQHNLMDAGGEFAGLFGVGLDGIGGTADDLDRDFGADVFYPREGLTGIEDTLSRTAFGLGRTRPRH